MFANQKVTACSREQWKEVRRAWHRDFWFALLFCRLTSDICWHLAPSHRKIHFKTKTKRDFIMDDKNDCPNPNCACDGPCGCGNTCTCIKPKEGAATGCDNEYCKVGADQNERWDKYYQSTLHFIQISYFSQTHYSAITHSVLNADVAKDVFAMFLVLRTSMWQYVADIQR
jgi:hypothetical protein